MTAGRPQRNHRRADPALGPTNVLEAGRPVAFRRSEVAHLGDRGQEFLFTDHAPMIGNTQV